MHDAVALSRTIGSFYDAMLEDDVERTWLDGLRSAVGAAHACLSRVDVGVDWWSCSRFSEHDRRIGDRFVHGAFYVSALRKVPAMTPFRLSRLVPMQAMYRSELYQHLIRPMDGGIALVYAWRQDGGLNAITICRSAERDRDFSDEEVAAAAPLLGHVRSAMRIRSTLLAKAAAVRQAETALDAIDEGVAIVARDGVRYLNAAARRVVDAGDGLRLAHGGLRASRPEDDRPLQALIQCALAPAASDAHAMRVRQDAEVAIARVASRSPLSVAVAPAQGLAPAFGVDAFPDAAVLLIRDPDQGRLRRLRSLADTFALTPREAALAGAIGAGDSLAVAARRMGVTEGTARQYLKGVFAKTGVRRQAELVGLLAGFAG